MIQAKGYAVENAKDRLKPYDFERRAPGPKDVQIEIAYCGVCHSDIHLARDEWGMSNYPMVPGHEIVGKVVAVGKEVSKFAVGDHAGVGCMVDSCRTCGSCHEGLEQFCENGMTLTYGSYEKDGKTLTQGGYSNVIVVDEDFTLRVDKRLDLAKAAPLLCAGITTYSPLRHWQIGPQHKVAVVGLGGLGHMALKFAKAFGAHVTQFTTSPHKVEDAKALGADEVILSKEAAQMQAAANRFDFILNTVSADIGYDQYLNCLKRDGTMVLVGLPEHGCEIHAAPLIFGRRSIAGSLIGGIPETQEMLDFCAEHGIGSDIEIIKADQINDAWERVINSDVKYRFVIDASSF